MVNIRLGVPVLFPLALAGANALSERQLLNQTYDYIIVGGGTSGLTVANRLTANGKRSVLVVEYGEFNNDPSILIPTDTLNFHPDRFYDITSLPMPALNNLTSQVLAGALVGGGSAVNGMFFDRGSQSGYDAWETLGNPGWSFEDLLPYFKKSVTFTPQSAEVAAKYDYTWDVESAYRRHREVQESFPPYQFPGQEFIWDAWAEIGVKKPTEAANGETIGAIQAPLALDPILFKDGGDLEAVGVSIAKRGTAEKTTIIAKREVIIAAGALWTPWLLQRSGVGPIEVLKSAGIKVKKNLPGVGANFQDHPLGGTTWNWTKSILYPTPGTLASNATFSEETRKEYEQFRTGPFTPARGNQTAFLPLSTVDPKGWQSLVDAIAAQDPSPYFPKQYDATLVKGFKAQQQLTAQLLARDDSAAYEFPFSSGPLGNGVLSRPLSRGTVNINTTDPSSELVVDFRTFSNPLDIQMALPIVHFTRRFNLLSSLAPLGPTELTPGLNVSSDAQIEAHLRATFNPTCAHLSGTASLLPEEYGGVVGPDLRVHGIAKLSVIDASVIPYLPATHLCTTVYAVAEKAADLIKARTAWDD